jgi:hypothetical protein
MDCIYPEFLDRVIKRYKNTIVTQIKNIDFNAESLTMHSDMICMVLDFSPKMAEEPYLLGKIN